MEPVKLAECCVQYVGDSIKDKKELQYQIKREDHLLKILSTWLNYDISVVQTKSNTNKHLLPEKFIHYHRDT